jgi:hypothetical protein
MKHKYRAAVVGLGNIAWRRGFMVGLKAFEAFMLVKDVG